MIELLWLAYCYPSHNWVAIARSSSPKASNHRGEVSGKSVSMIPVTGRFPSVGSRGVHLSKSPLQALLALISRFFKVRIVGLNGQYNCTDPVEPIAQRLCSTLWCEGLLSGFHAVLNDPHKVKNHASRFSLGVSTFSIQIIIHNQICRRYRFISRLA